ncbi:phosphonate ABC transporter periplasmic phosphonate-binding protein [Alcanivorax jadensis T9]|jgi:phosphonate transport system substrate-binding protein|uniref:Phosphonate ABC transporter periplasmic phosphonate-binding protein n=1 Tax=Alcanivorax jadensis T9 TaxID=1177181 RepID=A0ABR4WDM1_9GAMM|nr:MULTISPECIES: putative selenate ABC transporter substrate-binding protein [Alcanivorax]KGD61568.1 phosphonate ABC transporter periplasmic phosphonate-binding protein [Alcanivorax jadensis T9]MAC14185.1 putative selenate ABC transporter substrate-binding protein [Alcanivorax sp.]MBG31848.1 putative selenate ABC transporter substrate-binding protein [Alcanivorax sp.]MBP23606.1 putative selenate ABC transporter substrate-binding protein [Alcanivorax sp.]MDF1637224.1 putative selenate ABC trans|tara:strand:- start:45 stop:917 length:873 start_codon:yes stop_codon:yes gene_type:complete
MRFKLLAALFAALLLSACNEPHTGTFVFTAIPDQDESQLEKRFGVVALYLEEKLGVPVKYVPVKSYAAAVTAFRNNEVQMAWFGGLSGVQARRLVPGSQAIAQGLEDPDFKSYFIANTSTGLTQSDTLPESFIDQPSFTFGSKGSTSGRLMPEFYLRETFNQAPDQLFDKVGFSGDHSATIALVQSGAYATGAVNYKVWERELEEGKIDTSKVQVIWETPGYPDYHWTVRGDLNDKFGDGFSQRVTEALLAIDDPVLLNAFPREKFIPASNDDFAPIEETAEAIGLLDAQ